MLYMLMVGDMNWFECTDGNPFEIMQIVHRIKFLVLPPCQTYQNSTQPQWVESSNIREYRN
jgi:hypothetical protein